MTRQAIILTAIIISLAALSCKKDNFGTREEWPVSGTGNIDTGWFKPYLSQSTPLYHDGDIEMTYSGGGIIHSLSTNGNICHRFVDLSTGNEVTLSYASISDKSHDLGSPTLTVNGTAITLRHARHEKENRDTRWISASTEDKRNIAIIVNHRLPNQ